MALSLHQQSELLSGVTNEYLQKLLQNPEMMKELELMEAPVLIEVAERNPDTNPQVNTDTITAQKLRGMQEGMGGMSEGMGGTPYQEPGIGQFAQGGMIPGYHSGGGIEPHAHGPAVGHLIDDDMDISSEEEMDISNWTVPTMPDFVSGSGTKLTEAELKTLEEMNDRSSNFPEQIASWTPVDDPSTDLSFRPVGGSTVNDPESSEYDFDAEAFREFMMAQIANNRGMGWSGGNDATVPGADLLEQISVLLGELNDTSSDGELTGTSREAQIRKRIDDEEKRRQGETAQQVTARELREEIIRRQQEERKGLRSLQEEDLASRKKQILISHLLGDEDAYPEGLDSLRAARKDYSAEQNSLQNLIDTGQLEIADTAADRSTQSLFEVQAALDQALLTADRTERLEITKLMATIDTVTREIQAGRELTPNNLAVLLQTARTVMASMPPGNQGPAVEAIEELFKLVPSITAGSGMPGMNLREGVEPPIEELMRLFSEEYGSKFPEFSTEKKNPEDAITPETSSGGIWY